MCPPPLPPFVLRSYPPLCWMVPHLTTVRTAAVRQGRLGRATSSRSSKSAVGWIMYSGAGPAAVAARLPPAPRFFSPSLASSPRPLTPFLPPGSYLYATAAFAVPTSGMSSVLENPTSEHHCWNSCDREPTRVSSGSSGSSIAAEVAVAATLAPTSHCSSR
jgi:hypothetical protein